MRVLLRAAVCGEVFGPAVKTASSDAYESVNATVAPAGFMLVLLLLLPAGAAAYGGDGQAEADDADATVRLRLPENVEMRVLIEYVSDRLDLNIFYDRRVAGQRITLQAPREIPVASLRGVLESALKMNGYVLIEADEPGWLRIVEADDLQRMARRTQPLAADPDRRAAEVITAVHRIRHVAPGKVERVLQPFLSRPGGNIHEVPDRNTLIITDFASAMPRLTELVEMTDTPAAEVETRFVNVEHLDAGDLRRRIEQLLRSRRQARGVEVAPKLELAEDERTNQLILIGEQAAVEQAIAIGRKLDVGLELDTRVYSLRTADPQRIDRLAQQLIDPRDAERHYRSSIDDEGNLLIVTTTERAHAHIEALRERLDVELPEAESPMRFYRLRNADASEVLATIRTVEGEAPLEHIPADDAAGDNPSGSASGNASAAAPDNSNSPGGDAAAERRRTASRGGGERPPSLLAGAGDAPGQGGADFQPAEPRTPPVWEGDTWPELRPDNGMPSPRQRHQEAVRTGQATVVADHNTNTLIVVADPAVHRMYERLIERLDRRRPQVLIETTIVTVDTTDGRSLGVEIAGRGAFSVGSEQVDALGFSAFGLSEIDSETGELTLRPGAGFSGALLSPDIADVVIRALATSADVQVISAPQVLVHDNATGRINSVAEQPFTTLAAFDTATTTSFGGFVEAGTDITVTPQIAEGDHLNLDFQIALRNFTGDGGEGIPPPRQTNSVGSRVTVPDGHTVIVGGINLSDLSETVDKVPVLGDVPLLKHLFRSVDVSETESTLFVFIRPRILRDDQFRDLRELSSQRLQHAGLPGDAPPSRPMLMP